LKNGHHKSFLLGTVSERLLYTLVFLCSMRLFSAFSLFFFLVLLSQIFFCIAFLFSTLL